jgi:hypothetical protein
MVSAISSQHISVLAKRVHVPKEYGELQVYVHCFGFGKVENNWEPVELIAKDVPDTRKRVCS